MNDGRVLMAPHHRWFAALWLFIVSVSVYDGFCVLASRSSIQHAERNPIGQWLIKANGGDVWLLLVAKAIGTVVAAALLLWLHVTYPRLSWIVCINVAAFQLMLLCLLVGS